jgi:hypothetical protein
MKRTGRKPPAGARFLLKYVAALCLLLCAPLTVFSDERIVNVFAEVDADEIGLLDTVTLTVTVEAENIKRMPKPEVPDLRSFSILNESTRTQSSISIIDGKASRRKIISFVYTLKPEKKGTFTIDPVRIRYGGEIYKTEPLLVTVLEGKKRGEEDRLKFPDGSAIDLEKLRRDIYVQVKPHKNEILEGEQLFLTYTLYSRLDIDSISLKQNPNFPGFYIEDIYNATRLEYRKEEVEGRIYTTSLIKKVALFPLKPGTYTPEPLVLEATVIVKTDDLFDVFGRPFTFDVESNPFQIAVRQLPAPPQGIDFSGVVGTLEAALSLPAFGVRTGESMACFLTLKSTGNLNLISDPGLVLSNRGRIYLSETMQDVVEEKDGAFFVKKFEYTIIPEESGRLGIGTNEVTYYDTGEKQFITLTAEPVQLNVTGEDIIRERTIRSERRAFGTGTLQFIKEDVNELKSRRTNPLQSFPYFVYHLTLAIAAIALFFIVINREKLVKNVGLMKMRRASATAHGLLERANAQISHDDLPSAVNSIYRALVTYAADKSNRSPQDITAKTAGSVLEGIQGITGSTKEEFIGLFNTCMMMKFSITSLEDREILLDLRDKSVRIIDRMESEWLKNQK